jgi:hypothetical protein
MAQDVQLVADILMNWKQIMLAIGGYIVRLLWYNERPIKWMRVISGLVFLMMALWLIHEYVNPEWHMVCSALAGLFTNNIIAALFRFWNVNENALMYRAKKWWEK